MARFTSAAALVSGWQYRTGARPERLALLTTAWEREMGGLARHYRLAGLRGGVIYVHARTPAAAMELRLRAAGMVRALNKHFQSPWIKEIKSSGY